VRSARTSALDQRVVVRVEEFARVAAERIGQVIDAATARGARAQVALAGGHTPRGVYRALAQLRLPWNRVEIYFGDERAVPPDDPQSNYRMAREALLDAVPIPAGQIHRMPAERADVEAAAADYAAALPERFDLIILGIGADGHTASLFPGGAAVAERERKVVAVEAPKPPARRLTVTPPVITAARIQIVLAAGGEKSAAVARALEGGEDVHACPAQLARAGIWIIDEAAAARLRGGAARADSAHPPPRPR
jgi:6-phosphogluconolactonase